MEIVVKTELDKLRDENKYLQRSLDTNHKFYKLLCEGYEAAIEEFELKNKELQAEVERLNLLCMSPFK